MRIKFFFLFKFFEIEPIPVPNRRFGRKDLRIRRVFGTGITSSKKRFEVLNRTMLSVENKRRPTLNIFGIGRKKVRMTSSQKNDEKNMFFSLVVCHLSVWAEIKEYR